MASVAVVVTALVAVTVHVYGDAVGEAGNGDRRRGLGVSVMLPDAAPRSVD